MKRVFNNYSGIGRALIFLFVGMVFGNILHEIVLFTDSAEETTVFPLGTVMSIMVLFCYAIYFSSFQDALRFNTIISLGCTRREYYWGRIIEVFSEMLLSFAGIFLCYQFEVWKFREFYPDITIELDMTNVFTFKIMIPALLFLAACALTNAALVMKYGQNALWVEWIIIMFICIGVPRIIDRLSQKSGFIALVDNIKRYDYVIVIIVIIISLIMFCVDRILLMKQEVR